MRNFRKLFHVIRSLLLISSPALNEKLSNFVDDRDDLVMTSSENFSLRRKFIGIFSYRSNKQIRGLSAKAETSLFGHGQSMSSQHRMNRTLIRSLRMKFLLDAIYNPRD